MSNSRFPAHFGVSAWAIDMERTTARGRTVAQAARRDYEGNGVPITALRPTQDEGPDGTQLPGCLKTYVPLPAGAFGMVFEVVKAGDKPLLVYLAFGVRHHPPDSHSVYRIAHRRLHRLRS